MEHSSGRLATEGDFRQSKLQWERIKPYPTAQKPVSLTTLLHFLKLLFNKSLEAILPQEPISHQFIIQIYFPDNSTWQSCTIRYPKLHVDTHSSISHHHLTKDPFTSNFFLFYLIKKVFTATCFLSCLNPPFPLFPLVPFISL